MLNALKVVSRLSKLRKNGKWKQNKNISVFLIGNEQIWVPCGPQFCIQRHSKMNIQSKSSFGDLDVVKSPAGGPGFRPLDRPRCTRFIYGSEVGGMSPNGKSFWFLRMRDSEARVFFRFCPRSAPLRVPFLLPNARRKATKKKFTSRVGYQCKMIGNVSCTLPDG